MIHKTLFCSLFFFINSLVSTAQGNYGILFKDDLQSENCTGFNKLFEKRPKEIALMPYAKVIVFT
ncbi:hypothetical protein JCM19297_2977 [Nonlabens ulvanivorans]|nr:hypothetical protein [Nonlabens ulvanivorans]GAK88464.1 hypothetical protein JCM19297_2977 [Nonlabens ulvanivorans]